MQPLTTRLQILKKLRKLLKKGLKIAFIDECHFYQHGSRIRTWFPPEDRDPVVLQEPNRKGISVFGVVSSHEGKLLTELTDKYNALTFMHFLEDAAKEFPDHIFVLDNARYHHCSIISDFADFLGIRLLILPPYSPDLNPIERVWKMIRKKATHNVYFASLDELKDALIGQFKTYKKPNSELRQLCATN